MNLAGAKLMVTVNVQLTIMLKLYAKHYHHCTSCNLSCTKKSAEVGDAEHMCML